MSVDRKYQVFVSSTYNDLRIEREKVQQALLASDCFPLGMELFPPSDETQWAYIQKAINQCDYYILVIAGRYGTINPATSMSYTEQEYRYAVEVAGIPAITFFHRNPEKLPHELVEPDAKSQKKLETFRALALSKLAKPYSDPSELYGSVIQGVNHLKSTHPEGGWIPARYLPPGDLQKELESLRDENETLRKHLEEAKSGKTTIQAIDSKPNHVASRDLMDSYIRESLRTSDSITIRVMAVSLHYSWDFLKNDLPIIISDAPEHKKITLELEMVDPDHLGTAGLRDWREKGRNVKDGIAAFIKEEKETGRLIDIGRIELFLYQYYNIPHWHGTLINNQYLLMGRTRWVIQPDRRICRLTVGEEMYRLFASNDAYGGADRIAMFNCWFDYYKYSGNLVFSEYRSE